MIKYVEFCTADYLSNFSFTLGDSCKKKRLQPLFTLECCAVSSAAAAFDPSRKRGVDELWL